MTVTSYDGTPRGVVVRPFRGDLRRIGWLCSHCICSIDTEFDSAARAELGESAAHDTLLGMALDHMAVHS